MVLNKSEITERILKEELVALKDAKHQLQPASVDLTLEKVFRFKGKGVIDFDNSERVISEVEEISFNGDWVDLPQGSFKVQYAEEVRMPLDLAAVTFTRSSLARCGCDVYNGWWDPGYHGKGVGLLVVHNPEGVRLKKGAKIVQLVFVSLNDSEHLYEGVHKGENL